MNIFKLTLFSLLSAICFVALAKDQVPPPGNLGIASIWERIDAVYICDERGAERTDECIDPSTGDAFGDTFFLITALGGLFTPQNFQPRFQVQAGEQVLGQCFGFNVACCEFTERNNLLCDLVSVPRGAVRISVKNLFGTGDNQFVSLSNRNGIIVQTDPDRAAVQDLD